MADEVIGKVLGLAVRTARGGPMRELREADGVENSGLSLDLPPISTRGLTLISAPQWGEVTRELSVALPWHTRRANVLVDIARLGPLIGATVRIGELVLEVKNETKPCSMMDEMHAGLQNVLKPDCRGGVYGRIARGGRIRVGDDVVLEAPTR